MSETTEENIPIENEEPWLECQMIRYLGEDRCVIRLLQTGAVIPISLKTPLPAARAAYITPIRPVEARVKMGRFDTEWFKECELEVHWNTTLDCFPPPKRHKRRRSGL